MATIEPNKEELEKEEVSSSSSDSNSSLSPESSDELFGFPDYLFDDDHLDNQEADNTKYKARDNSVITFLKIFVRPIAIVATGFAIIGSFLIANKEQFNGNRNPARENETPYQKTQRLLKEQKKSLEEQKALQQKDSLTNKTSSVDLDFEFNNLDGEKAIAQGIGLDDNTLLVTSFDAIPQNKSDMGVSVTKVKPLVKPQLTI